ncbi:glycerate kinase [Arachnia rubra]|jgi:Glycerate kinase family.|uniref:Glycerate kinase n=1 Tax=Arachnia rubra TaxID=1547448 RepID=A0ABX7Y8L4_9ACTN|nr:glycerate kinase [Arachnia rubra]MBB1577876.1 glycerate kinase [Propionibacterium sp.]QUC09165.1 glycerate kinase [Arachnia rubra]BCR80622.1 hypothetical protein SK1NUM_10650 [Arachnia rubra]
MRVLVSCDRIGRLGSAEASDVIAEAFAERGAQVAVTPLAEGGDGFAGAVQRFSPGARVLAARSFQQVCELLGESPGYLDATAVAAPSLAELLELPVLPVGAGVTLVVPHREAGRVLTGLTGSLAERGRAQGAELAATLADDSRAAAWLERLGITDTASAGALCGLGAWALACGAQVASGIDVSVSGYRLPELSARADLVVTGTDVLDFHRRGGDVVAELTRIGAEALRPVVVVAGRNFVSSRELRLAGIEEAHAVARAGVQEIDFTAEELGDVARRVASTWTW